MTGSTHLRARAAERGHDILVVYADREHSANMAYLTGFEPRFEEAVLVVAVHSAEPPLILAGNECRGLAAVAPLPMDEWVNSPVWRGSAIELRSGMHLQVDVILATGGPYFTACLPPFLLRPDRSLVLGR